MLTCGAFILVLEHHHFVGEQFGDVELLLLLDQQRMPLHQKPTYVGEEESSTGIVGIRVRIAVRVVKLVISYPRKHAVLM